MADQMAVKTATHCIVPSGNLVLRMTSQEAWLEWERERDRVTREREFEDEWAREAAALGGEKRVDHEPAKASRPQADPDPPRPDVEIIVDAVHLMRVSKPFAVFLDPITPEGSRLLHEGRTELNLDEDDAEAMKHIMNCVFGRNKEVPGLLSDIPVDLETMLEACIIVDKYDLREPTYFLLEQWWTFFKNRRPLTVNKSFFSYLSVAHILKKHDVMEELLRTYMKHGMGIDNSDMLPLPDSLSKAEARRIHAFGAFNAFLEKLRKSINGDVQESVCTCTDTKIARECDEAIMTAITKKHTRRRAAANPAFALSDVMTKPGARQDRVSRTAKFLPYKCSFHYLQQQFDRLMIPHHCKKEVDQRIRRMEELQKLQRDREACYRDVSAASTSPSSMASSSMTSPISPTSNVGYGTPASTPTTTTAYYNNNLVPPSTLMSAPNIGPVSYNSSALSYGFVDDRQDIATCFDDFFNDAANSSFWQLDALDHLLLPPITAVWPNFNTTGATQEQPLVDLTGNNHLAQQLTPCIGPKKVIKNKLKEIELRMMDLNSPLEIVRID